jgi:hypothetical protein
MIRRNLLLAGLLVPASFALAQSPAAKQPPSPRKPAPTATPATPAMAVAPMKGADDLRDALSAQEQKVWDSIAHQDWAAFGAFLADDFVEITPMGMSDKASSIAAVKAGKLGKTSFSDWKAMKLGEGSALVMYKVEYDWTSPDGTVTHNSQFCCSTWTKQGSGWVAHTHQETEAMKAPMPGAPATPTKPASK